MKKTKYIFAAVAMLLLLIVISNPEWKSKKNNLQDKDRNIEIETQNLIEEKTGAYQGFTVDLIDMELIKNLKISMEKEMISRVNEIQSQMYALQTQMNPHFVHNILTIISAMSGTSEREKIPEICEKLSSMIRYNVNSSESRVDLSSELLHAENYLELMKIRYEEKFQYSMSYVGEMPNFHLPRFIIQPLLENCFAHGFHNKEFPWKIDIQIYCSEECWEVQIRDNGCGMDQEELEKLELELLEMRNRDVKSLMKELKIGGLTIKNVYLRLFLAYGNNMIFDISNKSEGMCITVGENYENTCTGS